MFCNFCGNRMEAGWKACPACGKPVASAAAPAPPRAPGRGMDHIAVLGVLWILWSVLHLGISSAAGLWWLRVPGMHRMASFSGPSSWSHWLGPLSGLGFLLAILGIVGACGLLARRRWARTLILVYACLALLSFPLGTALGAYTLWALLSWPAGRQMA